MTDFKTLLAEDLRKWVQQRWVDIGAPKKGGGYKPCGRSEGEKRKGYPKCVPAAKASSMSKKQKKSAVKRKRAAGNPGGKPTMVSTLKKTSKKSESMTRFKEALNELRGKCDEGKFKDKDVMRQEAALKFGEKVVKPGAMKGTRVKRRRANKANFKGMTANQVINTPVFTPKADNKPDNTTAGSELAKKNKKTESMTRFKEALNELRGKYAAKRAKSYQDQHRGERPKRGTPDQEKAFKKALGGRYNDTVLAASQGKVKKPGGETVTADYAAKTFHKAGKHAVAQARKKTGKLTYGRRPDGSRMSTGQGGQGDTRKKASKNEGLERFKNVILEKLCAKGKAAAKRKFDVYPSAYANMYGSAVCSGKVKPGGKKKNENKIPYHQMTIAQKIKADKEETAKLRKASKNANLTHRASRQAKGEVGPQTRTVITNDNKNK